MLGGGDKDIMMWRKPREPSLEKAESAISVLGPDGRRTGSNEMTFNGLLGKLSRQRLVYKVKREVR